MNTKIKFILIIIISTLIVLPFPYNKVYGVTGNLADEMDAEIAAAKAAGTLIDGPSGNALSDGNGAVTNNSTVTTPTTTPTTSASTATTSTAATTPATTTTKECDHDYVAEVKKEASCTETGITTYTCSKCGKSYTEEIPMKEHNYEKVVTKEATCLEGGEITYTCSECGDSYTEETKALGHDYVAKVSKPTCTEDGYTTYTCSRCGDTYTSDAVPATGHVAGEWEITKQPTMLEKGLQVRKCTVCGEILEEKELPIVMTGWYIITALVFGVAAIGGGIFYYLKKKKKGNDIDVSVLTEEEKSTESKS